MEEAADSDAEDFVTRFDADFALMAGETNRFIVDLLKQFLFKTDDYIDDEDK